MLVLTRKNQEKIFIGNNGEICVQIISINGNQVRLGIAAPREIDIVRDELSDKSKYKKSYVNSVR